MADVSRIDEIVDASAAVAAGITGVVTVWGVGTGKIAIPGSSPTKYIDDFIGNVVEPGTHVSDMPDAPRITNSSATVTEINWRVPMRIYLDKNDQGNARRLAAPFYGLYLTEFSQNAMLLGTCNSAEIASFDLFHDREGTGWLGIAMILSVWERLDLDFDTGPTPYL